MPDLPGSGVVSCVCTGATTEDPIMLDDGDKDPQDPSVPEPSEAEQCATLINECVEHSEHAAQTCGSSGIFNKIGSALAGFNSRWVVDQ